LTGPNAVTTRVTGDTTLRVRSAAGSAPAGACHTVRIDIESLPTGIAMPSATAHSLAARTAAYSRASSPGWPAAAIQLHDSLIRDSGPIGAAARLVIASPIAMRDAAAASSSAIGGRSPSAMTSPAVVSNPARVSAQSATGTWNRPIIGSRAIMPPTVRSPIVTRKLLSATAGRPSTRSSAPATLAPPRSSAARRTATGSARRTIRGGLPSTTSSGRSIGGGAGAVSVTTSRPSAVATPSWAHGARSRAHSAASSPTRSGAIART